jgi:predicted HTH transcriptional regulator
MPVNLASSEPNEPSVGSNSEPVETPTAQIPPNEPFTPEPEVKPESLKFESVSAPSYEPKSEPIPVILPPKNSIRELLAKAKNAIQFRKRKKLDRVMILFLKHTKITNDEVEKFLHVSDATATRYLSQLEKENKIKQVGKTGHAVSYSRI